MSVLQIRQELHRYIDLADDRFVAAVYAMMQHYVTNDESIVAYTVNGEPLTKMEFANQVNEAYADAKKGNVISTEDLLKQIENW